MQDTTVSSICRASDSGANARRKFFGRARQHHGNEDDLLTQVLITSWSLASGRTLRAGVKPQSLSADELIDFWADDFWPEDRLATASRAGAAGAAGAGAAPAAGVR
jgi:hypothetical protein